MVLHCEVVSVVLRESIDSVGVEGVFRMRVDVRLARKNSPEMLRASQRTTTIFWPFRSCLATMLARRPRRWPLPSMTTCVSQSGQRSSLPSSTAAHISVALPVPDDCPLDKCPRPQNSSINSHSLQA